MAKLILSCGNVQQSNPDTPPGAKKERDLRSALGSLVISKSMIWLQWISERMTTLPQSRGDPSSFLRGLRELASDQFKPAGDDDSNVVVQHDCEKRTYCIGGAFHAADAG
jgi:hypothetical protein